MRCFYAIPLPDAVRTALVRAQRELAPRGADVRWVREEALHLTVLFLGEVADGEDAAWVDALWRAAEGLEPPRLAVEGLGYFGPPRAPRVVWAGVREEGSDGLARLAARLADEARARGVALDPRPFAPHITLGRPRGPRRAAALISAIDALADRWYGAFPVKRIEWMVSERLPEGPSYCVLGAVESEGAKAWQPRQQK